MLAGTISGRALPSNSSPPNDFPPRFYAARRFYDSSLAEWVLAMIVNLDAYDGTATRATPVLQFAPLSSSTSSFGTILPYQSLPRESSFVSWSEAISRDNPPAMHYTSGAPTEYTYGIVLATNQNTLQQPFPGQARYTWWDSSSAYLKAAVTSCGLIQIAPGPPVILRLIVSYYGSSLSGSPPMRLFADPSPYATDVSMYGTSTAPLGPFTRTPDPQPPVPTNPNTYVSQFDLPANASSDPNCYFISFDGRVTYLTQGLANNDYLYVNRSQAPRANSNFTTDSNAWSTVTTLPTERQNLAGDYTPKTLALTNAGKTLVIIRNANGSINPATLLLYNVEADFTAASAFTPIGGAISDTEYGGGVIMAFGDNKLIWFSSETHPSGKYSYYRLVDLDGVPSCSASFATGFPPTVGLLTYMGVAGGSTLYVAMSEGLSVQVWAFSSSWAQQGSDYFQTNSQPILDLLVDTIEYAASSLIVAVCTTNTLFQEVTLV